MLARLLVRFAPPLGALAAAFLLGRARMHPLISLGVSAMVCYFGRSWLIRRLNPRRTTAREGVAAGPGQGSPEEYRAACTLLGLGSSFTGAGLKNRYHELLKKYHPDLYVNAAESLRENAAAKTRDVIRAYEYLMAHQPHSS
jgi:DnaJ-domain-containing protein 1